ncbi:hypothetical protein H632_c612p0, partial [Helicosporidium sp. ATCC 50920]
RLSRLARHPAGESDAVAQALLARVLETFTDVTRFPRPPRPDAAVLVGATGDAYVAPESVAQVAGHLPGSEVRWVRGGHVTSFLLHRRVFVDAVADAVDRLGDRLPVRVGHAAGVASAGTGMAKKKSPAAAARNVMFLDSFGSLLAEEGSVEEAVSVLQKSVQLEPEEGHMKYMYLGQLLSGSAAEEALQQGIALLRRELTRASQAATLETVSSADVLEHIMEHRSMLSSALCALAEHVMTTLADAEQEGAAVDEAAWAAVEARVEPLLIEAQRLDEESPEPGQAEAVLHFHQGRSDRAYEALVKSLSLWFRPQGVWEEEEEDEEAEEEEDASDDSSSEEDGDPAAFGNGSAPAPEYHLRTRKALGLDDESEDEDEPSCLPSFEFRFEAAKLLLSLGRDLEAAVEILEGLLGERDHAPDVWMLLAECHWALGDSKAALQAVEVGKQALRPGEEEDMTPAAQDLLHQFEQLRVVVEEGAVEEGEEGAAEKEEE